MRRPFRSIALLPILSLLASACTLRYSQTTFKDPVLQSEKAGCSIGRSSRHSPRPSCRTSP